MKKFILIIGARPNFMKAFPVYEALKNDFDLTLIHTGQHFDKKMSKVFFEQLKFPRPDIHLTLEKKTKAGDYDDRLYVNNNDFLKNKDKMIEELISYDGELGQLGEIRDKLKIEFDKINPDLLIVFGDVTSTLAASIAAKSLNIDIAHVESGLRSGDIKMPEEVNRILTDHITKYYFVTEQSGVDNLKAIGITENVYLVGNTMIDTQKKYLQQALDTKYHEKLGLKNKDYVLITLHRPSNVDDLGKLKEIFDDFEELSKKETLVYPIHPRTRNNLEKNGYLDKVKANKNIILCEPLGYLEFTCLIANSKYVVTDSGGIQEETTALDIPCFTLRKNTERPSTFIENHGTNQLIHKISEIELKPCKGSMDLWDGKSSMRIKNILKYPIFTDKDAYKNNNFFIHNPSKNFKFFINRNSKPKKNLVVFFSYNTNKVSNKYYFSRISWSNYDNDIIIIDDPTIYEWNRTIGWYYYDIFINPFIKDYIENYINYFKYNNITFSGSSVGGFGALYYGSFFKNSNIYVINPQLEPWNYIRVQYYNTLQNILKDLNINNDKEIILKYFDRLYQNNCSIIYYQNTQDSHYKDHFLRFKKDHGKLIKRIILSDSSLLHNDFPDKHHFFLSLKYFNRKFKNSVIYKNSLKMSLIDLPYKNKYISNISGNKQLTNEFLIQQNINCPKLYFKKKKLDNKLFDFTKLSKFILKINEGCSTIGVYILEKKKNDIYFEYLKNTNLSVFDINEIITNNDIIIEESLYNSEQGIPYDFKVIMYKNEIRGINVFNRNKCEENCVLQFDKNFNKQINFIDDKRLRFLPPKNKNIEIKMVNICKNVNINLFHNFIYDVYRKLDIGPNIISIDCFIVNNIFYVGELTTRSGSTYYHLLDEKYLDFIKVNKKIY